MHFAFINENAEVPLKMLVLTVINTRRAAYYLTEPCFCDVGTSLSSGPEKYIASVSLGYIDPLGFLDLSFFCAAV